jgi:hypothetical protein
MEKKTLGTLSRKIGEQFFKDCFELYCMRQGMKAIVLSFPFPFPSVLSQDR